MNLGNVKLLADGRFRSAPFAHLKSIPLSRKKLSLDSYGFGSETLARISYVSTRNNGMFFGPQLLDCQGRILLAATVTTAGGVLVLHPSLGPLLSFDQLLDVHGLPFRLRYGHLRLFGSELG